MPEGILPELLIAVALLAVVGGALFVSRRGRDDEPGAGDDAAPGGGVAVEDRPTDTAQTIAPPVEAPPVEDAPPVTAPPVETVPEEPLPVEAPRPTLRDRLAKSRKFFSDRLADAFGRAPDDETWEDVEAALIQADVGVETATRITESLKDRARERKITQPEEVKALLAEELVALFDAGIDRGLTLTEEGPSVWIVVGVNGTGKTTTIGKLSRDLSERGRTVSLAAADTFRAAADEQLGVWAERTGAQLVKHQHGADPGAVAFDAYRHARARGVDVLIVDTAGRLHTKTPLMDELGKVRRVIEKEGSVHETLLVIDATAGQNGLVQAREFAQAAGVTGVVLTKLDGTAKGGIALAIEQDLGIPIKLVGVGEGVDDMEPFDPKTFVDALLA